MKNLLWVMMALFVGTVAAVAKTPVEEDIFARTTDPNSPFYYTKLLMRFNNGDATLTDEDYHYLYYGYAYRDEYKPLNTNPDMEEVLVLMSGIDPDNVDRGQLEQLIIRANAARQRDPFSPKLLNILTFAYEMLGDTAEAERWARRMNGVVRAIVASGDGFTQRTPRHILMFDHALDVLAAEGLAADKARVVSRTVELVPLVTPYVIEGKKRKGIYFNFERIYWNKPEGYTYKRDRTWQFNNLKPRQYK